LGKPASKANPKGKKAMGAKSEVESALDMFRCVKKAKIESK
jgi:hypothetical protein